MLLPLTVAIGCGGRDMAGVRGAVTFKGQPVKSGVLIFSPIAQNDQQPPGKAATGDIQPDGSYQLSTYKLHDGAVVGRHRIRYMPAFEENDEKTDAAPVNATIYTRLTLPDDYQAEVQSGTDNEINVELVELAR
jgi:hypothetical protein